MLPAKLPNAPVSGRASAASPTARPWPSNTQAIVAAACRTIETAEEPPSLDALAKAAGMSRFHFHRVFTKIAGLTPKAYAVAHRAERMRRELPKRDTVTEAIYEAGFNSNGRFYAESSRMLGMTPKCFREGGTGEVIRFAVGECSLGSILVAASEKGVCAISLGDDPDRLGRELQDRFPKAQLIGGDRKFERFVAKVVGFVEAPGIGLDLPLDRARHGVPAESLAGTAQDSRRLDGQLHGSGWTHRITEGGAGGRLGVRGEHDCRRHPLSPGAAHRWQSLRLSLGRGTETRVATAGGGGKELLAGG